MITSKTLPTSDWYFLVWVCAGSSSYPDLRIPWVILLGYPDSSFLWNLAHLAFSKNPSSSCSVPGTLTHSAWELWLILPYFGLPWLILFCPENSGLSYPVQRTLTHPVLFWEPWRLMPLSQDTLAHPSWKSWLILSCLGNPDSSYPVQRTLAPHALSRDECLQGRNPSYPKKVVYLAHPIFSSIINLTSLINNIMFHINHASRHNPGCGCELLNKYP